MRSTPALRERRDTLPYLPWPSTIYRVLKRYQLNRRTPAMARGENAALSRTRLGELGPRRPASTAAADMFLAPHPRPRPISSALIDSCSAPWAWAEVHHFEEGRSPVMFRTLKMINTPQTSTYGLVFARNPGPTKRRRVRLPQTNPEEHPFEAIAARTRHQATRYTKALPGRRTNGKKSKRFLGVPSTTTSSKGATFDKPRSFSP